MATYISRSSSSQLLPIAPKLPPKTPQITKHSHGTLNLLNKIEAYVDQILSTYDMSRLQNIELKLNAIAAQAKKLPNEMQILINANLSIAFVDIKERKRSSPKKSEPLPSPSITPTAPSLSSISKSVKKLSPEAEILLEITKPGTTECDNYNIAKQNQKQFNGKELVILVRPSSAADLFGPLGGNPYCYNREEGVIYLNQRYDLSAMVNWCNTVFVQISDPD